MFYLLSFSGLSVILPFCLNVIVMITYNKPVECSVAIGNLLFDLQFIVTPDVCVDMCLVVTL